MTDDLRHRETNVDDALAGFVRDRGVPDEARTAARRALATAVPLAVGAVDDDAPSRVLRLVLRIGGNGSSTVLGATHRSSPALAAMVNGTAANSDDFDDTDLVTSTHPSAAVVPAALAAAEHAQTTLGVVLDAIAIGNEVATRIGRAFGAPHIERGWHVSSTANQLGAGAAAAAVLGLDEVQIRQVLGLCATQVAGLGAALGTMTKPFHFGKAASNGVEAALLVEAGLTAPERGIDGRRGLLAVVAPDADPFLITGELGSRWDLVDVMPKPYPCGYVSHPAVDAAIELHDQVRDPASITRLRAHVHRTSLDFMDRPSPAASLEAKLSLQYCIAAAVRHGRLGLGEFESEALTDPLTGQLMGAVELVGDRETPHAARIEAHGARGATWASDVPVGRGTRERPLTDDEVVAKGEQAATRTLSSGRARALVDACFTAADDVDVRTFTALAARNRDGDARD